MVRPLKRAETLFEDEIQPAHPQLVIELEGLRPFRFAIGSKLIDMRRPWLREGSNRGIAVLCLRGCQSIEIIGCARHGLCDSSKEASFDRTMFHDAQSLHCRSDSTDIVQ